MENSSGVKMILVLLVGGLCMVQPVSVPAGDKAGITHIALLKSVLPDTANEEAIVWDTEYAPGAVNPWHLHPAAITFRILSGTGVWQEKGKPPVALHAGDNLFVPAGTIHSHWNPSTSDPLRFLEFIVAPKDQGRAILQPETR